MRSRELAEWQRVGATVFLLLVSVVNTNRQRGTVALALTRYGNSGLTELPSVLRAVARRGDGPCSSCEHMLSELSDYSTDRPAQ